MKKAFLSTILAIFLLASVANRGHAKELSVTFLNPGSAKDIGVWRLVSNFMQAAADDLGIDLEILYADRNHIKMISQAEKLAMRSEPPDYVIMVNEKLAGKGMLLSFKNKPSKIFFIHNGLTAQQRGDVGNERETIKNWIGTVVMDEYLASNRLIKELYRLTDEPPNILGITGTKSTPVSLTRLRGVTDYIKQAGRGKHVQVVYGNWSYEDGKEKTLALLKRHKDVNIIWAANDSMAMGAYDAAREIKYNKNISVGGLGGFPDALESIKNGGMKVTVAGHIMTGAWALALIYDYHFGVDFINEITANYSVGHNTVISTAIKADQFSKLIIDNPQKIDFRKFSKKLNPQLKKYEFSYDKIVESIQ